MKNKFPEFYDKPDLEELWKNCHFIFDTNVFINLYNTYSKKTYEKFIEILEDRISNRIWMPYQIGLEYQNNRIKQVKDKEIEFKNVLNGINNLKGTLNNAKDPIIKITDNFQCIDLSNYIDLDLIKENYSDIEKSINDIKESIDEEINFLEDDEIREKLDCIFKDRVGDNYPALILKELHKEGEYRYAAKIPPGFEDKNKKTGNPYGDLVLWFQMMDYAKKQNVPIIFVTDEEKKDWWLTYKINKKKELIGPEPQLIKEFFLTGQEFYMYRFSDFLSNAKEYLEADVESEIIESVKDVEELEDLVEELNSDVMGSINLEAPYISSDVYDMVRKQQEMIKSGSYNAVQEIAKIQQDFINSGGVSSAQEMVRKQQEMINSGSYNAVQEIAKIQQDFINSGGSSAVQELLRLKQELISSGSLSKLSKNRKKTKKDQPTKGTPQEKDDN